MMMCWGTWSSLEDNLAQSSVSVNPAESQRPASQRPHLMRVFPASMAAADRSWRSQTDFGRCQPRQLSSRLDMQCAIVTYTIHHRTENRFPRPGNAHRAAMVCVRTLPFFAEGRKTIAFKNFQYFDHILEHCGKKDIARTGVRATDAMSTTGWSILSFT